MTLRADWHLGELVVDESDPFADPPALDPAVEGIRVDLTDPLALQGRLAELLDREGQLYNGGVTCPIKDRTDSCCSACPLRGSYTARSIQELCKLGTEQERTVMAIHIANV